MTDPPPPPEYWDYAAIRERADLFLKRYWPNREVPVPIEDIVDVDIGLNVIPVEHLRSRHDVEGFLSMDRQSIYIDHGLYTNPRLSRRYRFTLAHEVGHWFLHEPLYAPAAFEDFEDWRQYLSGLSDQDQFFYENQAYCFAGLILVPTEHLEAVAADAINEAETANPGYRFDPDQLSHCEYLSEKVARGFGVSGQCILKRGFYDGLWSHRKGA